MTLLIVGLALFLGCHLLPVFSRGRATIRARLGEGAFKGLFSLVSAVGLVLIVIGFAAAREAGSPVVWTPPAAMRHITMLIMLPVFIFLIAAYVPGHIKAALKHPMLVAVKLWALAHLLTNGDLAGIVLFGSFLAWAVIDRISVKRRAPAAGAGALAPAAWRNDALAIAGGLAVYAAFVMGLHLMLIGVPIL